MFYVTSLMTAWEVQCHSVLVVLAPSFDLLLEELLLNRHGLSRNTGNRNCCHTKRVTSWDEEVSDSITSLTHIWVSSKPMSNQRDNEIAVDFLKRRDEIQLLCQKNSTSRSGRSW